MARLFFETERRQVSSKTLACPLAYLIMDIVLNIYNYNYNYNNYYIYKIRIMHVVYAHVLVV